MTPLYLKHIALRQFRSFARLDVELMAQPSVLIVHGSNGLGKSSLFDALEWALSDQIDHFRDASGVNRPGKYLCRWREGEPGPTSTTMTFSDENVIERSLLSARSTKSHLAGTVPHITDFLRAPAWQQRISELQRYLLLTHFLGQSTLSRLTHRKSNERFDILKEAAQSTAIEAISNALHGQGNNTVVRAYARQSEMLERDAKTLSDLLEQENSLWAEAQIAGAIDDATAGLQARRIAAQLTAAQLGDRVAPGKPNNDIEPSLEGLQAAADQIERHCLAAEGQLEDARRLYGERQRALVDLAEVVASRAATQKRLEAVSGELDPARIVRGERLADVAPRQQALAAASTAIARLRTLRDARAIVTRLTNEHRDSVAARATAEQSKAAAERNVTLAERKRQIKQRLTGEIARCDEELDRLRDNMATIDQAIACDNRIRDQSDVVARLEAASPDIDEAAERAEAIASAAANSVIAQEPLVKALRDTVDTMSNAIASIAIHLPAGACDCPLCATHFDSASDLQARVSTAAQRLAPALVAQEDVFRGLSAARETRVAELQQLRAAQEAIHSARAALKGEREHRDRVLARLAGGASGQLATLTVARMRVADAIEVTEGRRRRKVRWQTHQALGGSALDAEHSRAVRVRDTAQRTLDASTRRSADLRAALNQAKSDEERANSAMGAEQELGADELPGLIDEANGTLRRTQEDADRAIRAFTDADAAVTALEGEQAGLRGRLDELDLRKSEIDQMQRITSDAWLGLRRFGSEPDLAPVQDVERRIVASRIAAKEALGQLARLREGRLAWARQLSQRAVLEQIREQVDGPPNSTREELLASATSLRSRKQADAKAIGEVKEIARAASAAISAELEGFNSEYIKPLGFLMAQINQAILCDPRVGIDLHVKKKKIEQSAIKGSEVPKTLGDIDPVLVHSEGQMAALAVSMLCAASLTFPWSRWKALILDDPLQHNDSIHAAAFADLMGNLVSAEGYQVLLSTHDVAQAEFLLRKFRSRRIPCTTLSLLGIGKEGVEWSVQSSSPSGAALAS